MATLKQIVSSLLRDMVKAQHEADLYAEALRDSYAVKGKMASLPIPNVKLSGIDIVMKYAVAKEEETVEENVLDAKENDRFVRRLSAKLARLIIRITVKEVKESKVDYEPNGFSYIDDLGDNQEMIDYIAQRMDETLSANTHLIYKEDHSFDIEYIADQVLAVGQKYILNHSEIVGLFLLPGGDVLRSDIVKALDNEVSDSIRVITEEVTQASLFKQRRYTSVDVIIDSNALSKLPSEGIQTLTIHIGQQDINNNEKTE
jgi:hypothetical protein